MSGNIPGSFAAGIGQQLIVELQGIARILSANGETLKSLTPGLITPPSYPAASLPAVTTTNAGQLAFVSNARNTGEAAGAGTGALCCVNQHGIWVCVWSGVAPTT